MIKPQILLVNDDPASLMAMESLLTSESSRREYTVVVARSGEEALRKVLTHEFAVILLDVNMPVMNGFETAEAIHSHPRSNQVPIIFITAHFGDEIYRLKGYQKGAVDYLFTPVIPQILLTKVAVFVELHKKNLELQQKTDELACLNQDLRVQTMQDLKRVNARLEEEVQERKLAEERARELAIRDPLTGLLNRRSLIEQLNHAITLSARGDKQFALLFLDLDKFKIVNDTLGHEAGDELLREVSRRLGAAIRESDTAARLGGDEFVILLEVLTSPDDITKVAQKISHALSTPYHIGEHDISSSATIGIAIYPSDGKDVQTLMKHADLAMYSAKHQRRGSIQFFNPGLNLEQVKHGQLQKKFAHAVKKREFVVYYQPKVNLKTGVVTAIEASLRWAHPRNGVSCAAQLISAVTDTTLLALLDRMTISAVCEQIRLWLDKKWLHDDLPVIINCTQLSTDIAADIAAAIRQYRLTPSNIQLHVTEALLLPDITHTSKALANLTGSGIISGISGFGIGYSSLKVLKDFSLNFMKIESSIVQNLEDANNAKILGGIIQLAHAMSLTVVADGVTTRRQLDILHKLGCDDYQGSLFADPLPANELLPPREIGPPGQGRSRRVNQKKAVLARA